MDKANTEGLWTLFQETSLEELTNCVKTAEKPEDIRFFKELYNIKLAKRQQEIIQQDEFVM